MRVTNVVFSKLCPVSKGVCAEASIVLDDEVCIHKVKVIQGDKGLLIAFPPMRLNDFLMLQIQLQISLELKYRMKSFLDTKVS